MAQEEEKKVASSPVTDSFKSSIKTYLDGLAKKDPLFEESYANKEKNLDDCCRYIIGEVKASGKQGFTDDEIFGMATHYYDEADVKIKDIGKVSVIVNHEVQLAPEEIEKAKQEAYKKAVEAQVNFLQNKTKPNSSPVEKKVEAQQQLSLF